MKRLEEVIALCPAPPPTRMLVEASSWGDVQPLLSAEATIIGVYFPWTKKGKAGIRPISAAAFSWPELARGVVVNEPDPMVLSAIEAAAAGPCA